MVDVTVGVIVEDAGATLEADVGGEARIAAGLEREEDEGVTAFEADVLTAVDGALPCPPLPPHAESMTARASAAAAPMRRVTSVSALPRSGPTAC
jgi:hypothetical protein